VHVQSRRTYPLSFTQQRLWFVARMDPTSSQYNMSRVLRLRGRLDVPALRGALNRVVARHEALRTVLPERDGEPVQLVLPEVPLELAELDVRAAPDPEREARELVDRLALTPFDLAAGPLVRAHLVTLGDHDHVLALVIHHIVCDGWTLGLIEGEIDRLYNAALAGEDVQLPAPALQYGDYTLWQRELVGRTLGVELTHWRRVLDGAPCLLDLPTDRPRPAVQAFRAAMETSHLSGSAWDTLVRFSRRRRVSPFMTLVAALGAQLSVLAESPDMVLGIPMAARSRAEFESVAGFFTNTLALRIDATGDPSFEELVRRVRAAALEAYNHQELPFLKLVEGLRLPRTSGHSPLAQTMFTLERAYAPLRLPGLTAEPIEIAPNGVAFDFSISVTGPAQQDGPAATPDCPVYAVYDSDLFDPGTVDRLMDQYTRLVEAALERPESTLSELPRQAETRVDGVRVGQSARWLPGGTIERMGRPDDRVALRGYRVSRAELELALREHRAVAEAHVPAPGADGRLVAYVVPAGPAPEPGSLREHLAARLAHPILPEEYVVLTALPRTATGEVDAPALQAPVEPAAAAPRTELEGRLVRLWSELLDSAGVGTRDNFFQLGGSSMLLVRMQRRVQEEFGWSVPLVAFFEHPSVESLARFLARSRTADGDGATSRGAVRREALARARRRRQVV
jgi:Condensation domain/Phosphopantetheine attachment site/AMP-binding enzyme C-terminal domain